VRLQDEDILVGILLIFRVVTGVDFGLIFLPSKKPALQQKGSGKL
jgi:hypothetical protein